MMSHLKYVPIPGFLFLCLVLGGASNGGFVENGILQVLGVVLLAWALWSAPHPVVGPRTKWLERFIVIAIVIVLLQFVPLTQSLWRLSHAREVLEQEGALAGIAYGPKFWALLPYEALKSLAWALPPLALALALLRLSCWKPELLAWVVIAVMVLSVLVGTIQVTTGQASAAYFYTITNRGSTVGFFANSNHLATLLLISIPFIAALVARNRKGADEENVPFLLLALGLLLLALVGIYVNGSLAGFGLVGPVLLASLLIAFSNIRLRRAALFALPAIILAGLAWLLLSDQGRNLLVLEGVPSGAGRDFIWSRTFAAIADYMPHGSGLGSFAEVFVRYEDPGLVTNTFINHAHNDYLELVLELGLLSVPLLLGFLAWWGIRTIRIWLHSASNPFALAATIASGAVLVHSIVDYPLRTAAISSLFMACLVMMTLWIPGDGFHGKQLAAEDAD